MDHTLFALVAAIGASVGVVTHGVIGHRWLMAQLRSVEMGATPLSLRLFGPDDVSTPVFTLAWHVVTLLFASAATVLFLTAFGALESRDLLRYIAAVQAGIVSLGLVIAGRRLRQLIKAPVPIVFFASMTVTGLFSWIASTSL